mgnify:CR=1 FL=1
MKEFYRREAAQEEAGTMYCLELPQNADGKKYCIDSGFSGNHARFINHSVSLGLVFTASQQIFEMRSLIKSGQKFLDRTKILI